jgi:hypothetical protein
LAPLMKAPILLQKRLLKAENAGIAIAKRNRESSSGAS